MIDGPTPDDPTTTRDDPKPVPAPIPFDFEVFRENDRDAPDDYGALGDFDARRVDALRQPENDSDGQDETRRGAERRAGDRRERRDERTKSVVASPILVEPPSHRRRYRRSRALLRLVALLMVPVLLTGVAFVWFNQQVSHGSPGGAPVIVTIKAGSSNSEIGDALAKAKVIDNALIFKLYAKWKHHSNLKAGEYTLQEHMGIKAAIVQLEAGAHVERLVLRIKPGLWLHEVADQVAAQLKLNPAKFISLVTTGAVRSLYQPASVVSTEGLLFPDTYFFTKKSTELDVLRTMVARFDEVAKRLDIGPAAARIGQTPYRVAIVASLIQSEV